MKILILISLIINGNFFSKAIAKSEVESAPQSVCGKVTYLSGDVSLLDSDRKDYQEIGIGTNIHCGDWISTAQLGKVVIDFNSYGKIIVGLNTFFQVVNPDKPDTITSTLKSTDRFVLFRGDVYFEGNKKTKESTLVTPNSRVFLKEGKSLISFIEGNRSTQVISLEGIIQFKNRFLNHDLWKVQKGYISSITDGEERLVPQLNSTIEGNSLNLKLTELDVPPSFRKTIVEYVTELSKKKVNVRLGNFSSSSNLKNEKKEIQNRGIASVKELKHETQKETHENEAAVVSSNHEESETVVSHSEKMKHSRKPASRTTQLKKSSKKSEPKSEVEVLLKEISNLKEGDEE